MDLNNWMVPQAPCWFKQGDKKDEEKLFFKGRILEGQNNSDQILVMHEKGEDQQGELKVVKQNVFQRDENQENQYFDDMVQMATLNESELLLNIQRRYSQDQIFTYIGPTLIVINPYKRLDDQFSHQTIEKIKKNLDQHKQLFSLQQQNPHVYAISALSFKNLFQNHKKQAIVISGESGAGKTENAKYAMKFLTQLSNNQDKSTNKTNSLEEISIEDRILSCNPLLEAFGNAKTVRNDNSSRFGKYVKILVNKSQRIIGAEITKYLLEKSRVIHLSEGERNYHIFYHIIKGGDKQIIEKIGLSGKNIEDFIYLNQSKCQELDGINDQEMFQGILESLRKMKFSDNLEISIFKLLSAILYLGNVEFDDKEYDVNTPCKIVNEDVLQIVANLLSANADQIKDAFTKKARQTPNQVIYSPVTKNECINNKNSLSKALYDKLFTWLVGKLNNGIIPLEKEMSKQNDILSIGLLDIFGFENFQVNSFEQMCINYTNEYLQQLYISYVFKNEEKIFINDGLQKYLSNLRQNQLILKFVTFIIQIIQKIYFQVQQPYKGKIKFSKQKIHFQILNLIKQSSDAKLNSFIIDDNQVILDLFDSNNGIFALLNESCLLKNSSDTQFLNKIKDQNQNNKKVIFPKLIQFTFNICHTQSNVEYNVDGFREKNSDELNSELQNSILNSHNLDIVDIFSYEEQSNEQKLSSVQSGKSFQTNAKNKYLCSKFKQQMTELMNELNSSDVHFVRCIKPNEVKRKDYFLQGYVMQQIRYLGVLESIEVRKHTYPMRKEYQTFFKQYRVCSDKLEFSKRTDFKELCKEVLIDCFKEISDKQVLFGESKIYLKQEYETQLDIYKYECIKKKQSAATIKIQQTYRRLRKQKRQRASVIKLNSVFSQIIFSRLFNGFDKIQSKAKEFILLRFNQQIINIQKTNKIVSFYAIKEHYLKMKAIEEIKKQYEADRLAEEMKLNQKQEEMKFQQQQPPSISQESTQISTVNSKQQYNLLLNDQYDTKYQTNSSTSNYQTSIVEPSGATIDANKFYYQEDEEKRQNFVTNQKIDIKNYQSKYIQDWNQFSIQDPEFSGETIFIPRPTEEENQRAITLSKLLDTKPNEKVEEPVEQAEDSKFQLADLEEEVYNEIKSIDLYQFYKKHLNKRTNYFGVKKDEKDILTYQKKSLSKGSLIQVNDLEKKPALQHFTFLLDFLQTEENCDVKVVISHISDLILICLKKSTQFYNEIVTQLIKQLNKNKKEAITIKILQYLKVFLYCFIPEDEFLTALMNFLIIFLYENQWKNNQKIKSYILYIIPSIIRKIDQENPRKQLFSTLLPQYEISALIQKLKIPVPIVFSTGLSISVCADSWDTIEQLKEKIMTQVQINTERIKVNYLQIFELQFEDNQASEKMLLPDQYIWDILYLQNQKYIEKVQIYKEQNNNQQVNSEIFMSVLMIRVLFPYTLYPDDVAGISLTFSQVFFDIFVGKQIFHEDEKIIQLSALLKVINDCQNNGDTETISSLPLIMDQKSKEDMIQPIMEEYERIKGKFTLLQAKYIYLTIAKDNEYYMGLQIPVKYIPETDARDFENQQKNLNQNQNDNEFSCSFIDGIVVLKPTFFFIITSQTKKKIIEYPYQRVERWGRSKDEQQDHLLIHTNDNVKHLIQSKYAAQIYFYLQEAKSLITEKKVQNSQLVEELMEYYENNQQFNE